MSLRFQSLVVATTASMAISACGGQGDAHPATPRSATVAINSFEYSPTPLTVKAGATITVANRDNAEHTLTATRTGAFDSGTIGPKASAKVKFAKAGTFTYICQFHPFMKGTVTVTS